MKSKLFSALAICAIAFLFSCKGKDGAPGPAGPSGSSSANQNIPTTTEGYAKGTATGTNLDATTFSYNLDFEGVWDATQNYQTINASSVSINVEKKYAGQGDAFT